MTPQPPEKEFNTDCPELSLLVAFIEGTLPAENKNGVIFHLRQCQNCYQLVVDSVRLVRDLPFEIKDAETEYALSEPLKSPAKRKLPAFIRKIGKLQGVALLTPVAAGLLLLTILKGGPSWHTDEVLQALEKEKDFVVISRSLPIEASDRVTLGFNSGLSDQKLAFKTGSLLSRLEISRFAGDEEKLKIFTSHLADLLDKSKHTKNLLDPHPDQIADRIASIEKHFFKSSFDFYFKLGVFVESGKAYSLVHKSELFDKAYLNILINDPRFKSLPPGVTRRLKEIENLLGKNSIAQDHEIIYNLLQDIQQILS